MMFSPLSLLEQIDLPTRKIMLTILDQECMIIDSLTVILENKFALKLFNQSDVSVSDWVFKQV